MSLRTPMTRRTVLKSIGFGGAAGLSLALWDRVPRQKPASATVRDTRLLMGTVVNVAIVGEDIEGGRSAIADAFDAMQRHAGIFNRYDPASPLSALNARGTLRTADPALAGVLRQAEAVSLASQGAFDVTVLPLVDLYRNRSEFPSDRVVRDTLESVGHQGLRIGTDAVALDRPGMGVTLDGIAKGAVIDAGLQALRARGFHNCLVEAGGDLAASGASPAGRAWRVGLRPPRAAAASAMPRIVIGDRAVATSGDYLQSYAPDFSAHHILDPRRGVSPSELASVTIIAPSAVLADALATAVMVAGVRGGLALLEGYPDCDAILFDKQMRMAATPGMKAYLA